jgi:hypothetical protein
MATIQTDDRAMTVLRDAERPPRRTRPSTEYWNYLTADWCTAGPIPQPRRGT